MIAIGIPSYNEALNISNLVEKIDYYSNKLNEHIIIINSDNNSPDNTSEIFQNTKTKSNKISLVTSKKGKGYNLNSIFKEVLKIKECIGCILIDADITSLDEQWLYKNFQALKEHNDYIIPNYKRNFQEGNTTNHFIFPLVQSHIKNCPMQLIAGDFGLSRKYIDYIINDVAWHEYAYTYGTDIFLSLHALYGKFKIKEIDLNSKLHNPSFNKMQNMFLEVASSYYETKRGIRTEAESLIVTSQNDYRLLTPQNPIKDIQIKQQRQVAFKLLEKEYISTHPYMSDYEWAKILYKNELNTECSSEKLARDILPYFLIRVTDYLQTYDNEKVALNAILNVSRELRNLNN